MRSGDAAPPLAAFEDHTESSDEACGAGTMIFGLPPIVDPPPREKKKREAGPPVSRVPRAATLGTAASRARVEARREKSLAIAANSAADREDNSAFARSSRRGGNRRREPSGHGDRRARDEFGGERGRSGRRGHTRQSRGARSSPRDVGREGDGSGIRSADEGSGSGSVNGDSGGEGSSSGGYSARHGGGGDRDRHHGRGGKMDVPLIVTHGNAERYGSRVRAEAAYDRALAEGIARRRMEEYHARKSAVVERARRRRLEMLRAGEAEFVAFKGAPPRTKKPPRELRRKIAVMRMNLDRLETEAQRRAQEGPQDAEPRFEDV